MSAPKVSSKSTMQSQHVAFRAGRRFEALACWLDMAIGCGAPFVAADRVPAMDPMTLAESPASWISLSSATRGSRLRAPSPPGMAARGCAARPAAFVVLLT
eukprot:scaffold3310_cov121-Isochrysis_galbana.AAC.3